MLHANLHRRGYKVQAATSGAQALNLAARRRPDAVILDMGLPDIDGFRRHQRAAAVEHLTHYRVVSPRSRGR